MTTSELVKQTIKIKDYLSTKDIVLVSGYSYSSVMRAKNNGKLKSNQPKTRGKLLFHKDDVKSWIEGGE
tara:strand:- start:193 stop:399 length:207 start_codon:yes stop_codon:yes gene_type:complete